MPEAAARRSVDTAPLLVLAAGLIVNSHLEDFYPARFLAADGLLGNSLFFLLSGFGLQASYAQASSAFLPYCRRRVARIYPPLIISIVVFGVLVDGAWRYWQPFDYVTHIIWPTQFTYIRCIIPFYVAFYFVMRARWRLIYPALLIVFAVAYLFAYVPDAMQMPADARLSLGMRVGNMHDIAYFEMLLLGGWLARWPRRVGRIAPIHIATASVLFVYFALKYLMVVEGRFASLYGLLHLLVFVGCGLMFVSLTDERTIHRYRDVAFVSWAIAAVAGLTLEIYLVHSYLIEHPWLSSIRFPINIAVLLVLTLAIAWVLSRASNIVRTAGRLLPDVRRQPALGEGRERGAVR